MSQISLSKKIFLMGNPLTQEGITTRIAALGHSYEVRNPYSTPINWAKIGKDLYDCNNSGELLAVFLLLTERTLFHCSQPEYQEVWHHILMEFKRTDTLIFIYEDNLQGKFTCIEERLSKSPDISESVRNNMFSHGSKSDEDTIRDLGEDLDREELFFVEEQKEGKSLENRFKRVKAVRDVLSLFCDWLRKKPDTASGILELSEKQFIRAESLVERIYQVLKSGADDEIKRSNQLIKDILASGIEVVSYKKNRDISIRVQQCIDDLEHGIFLQLYVPYGRFQADQLSSFLRLFEDYLQHIEKVQFAVDQRRTAHGVVYLFKSKDYVSSLQGIEKAFSQFAHFMDLCQNDYTKAETILTNIGVNPIEANKLITKYNKDYQRLKLDIQHEIEMKIFEFEHKRLTLRHRLESEALESGNGNTPNLAQPLQTNAFLSLANASGPVTINILNPSINNNSGEQWIAEEIINGDITYTAEDKDLIALFQKYAEGLDPIRLKSELEQLKDTSSGEDVRKTAKQKIVSFLQKVAPSIGQTALSLLSAYLEKVLIGK